MTKSKAPVIASTATPQQESVPKPLELRHASEASLTLDRSSAPAPPRDAPPLRRAFDFRNVSVTPPALLADALTQGRALDGGLRRELEPRLGISLGAVRVHDHARAHRAANLMGARAFAIGSDIVFGWRQYEPSTEKGRTLLAHELVHVAQQRGIDLPRADRGAAEADAHRAAAALAAGRMVSIERSAAEGIYRDSLNAEGIDAFLAENERKATVAAASAPDQLFEIYQERQRLLALKADAARGVAADPTRQSIKASLPPACDVTTQHSGPESNQDRAERILAAAPIVNPPLGRTPSLSQLQEYADFGASPPHRATPDPLQEAERRSGQRLCYRDGHIEWKPPRPPPPPDENRSYAIGIERPPRTYFITKGDESRYAPDYTVDESGQKHWLKLAPGESAAQVTPGWEYENVDGRIREIKDPNANPQIAQFAQLALEGMTLLMPEAGVAEVGAAADAELTAEGTMAAEGTSEAAGAPSLESHMREHPGLPMRGANDVTPPSEPAVMRATGTDPMPAPSRPKLEVIEGGENTSTTAEACAAPRTRTPRQSEKYVEEPLVREHAATTQRSSKGGKTVPHGTPRSVRPDVSVDQLGIDVEVKNYDLTTSRGRNALVNKLVEQGNQRAANLPAGRQQAVVIDAAGQNIPDRLAQDIIAKLHAKAFHIYGNRWWFFL